MTSRMNDSEIKICCATFYQSDIVRMLLGDVLHPGGLALTYHLGEVMALCEKDNVLDVACGRGMSAVHLARRFGCHVTGLDYGKENVVAAVEYAEAQCVSHLTSFRQGDAEGLPFNESAFEAVISECSFCTFPNKTVAASEMARVLGSGGRLGLTDMTVNGTLPEDIQSLLSWVSCVSGAGTSGEYVAILKEAGFTDFIIEDHGNALKEMVNDVRRKMMGVEMASALGKLDLGDIDINEGKRLALSAINLIEVGILGYTLIVARNANS